ncbi:MAG: thioredoxin family protein [Burkholderiales bacterium]|nr:thioredoxin family protein [Burkholderiales bacterium]
MLVQLLVSEWCHTCPAAEKVWRDVADERDFDFAVVDVMQPEGRAIVARLRVRAVPSVVVDGELKAVGVQTPDEARALVAAAPARAKRATARHAGMILSRDDRAWLVAALAYLAAAAAALAWHASLLPDGPARAGAVHLFAAGFVVFTIYGLGAHMLPRFTGNAIRAGAWAWTQLALANIGLPALAAGFWFGLRALALAGGVLLWLSLAVFAARVLPLLARGTASAAGDAFADVTAPPGSPAA